MAKRKGLLVVEFEPLSEIEGEVVVPDEAFEFGHDTMIWWNGKVIHTCYESEVAEILVDSNQWETL